MVLGHITSRKNEIIQRLRALASDTAFRRAEGEYLCDGHKLLFEALAAYRTLEGDTGRERAA